MHDFRKYIDIVDEENIANESVLDWVADYLGYKPKDPKLGKLLYKQAKLKSEIDKLSKELDDINFEIKNHPEIKANPQGNGGQSVRSRSVGDAVPQSAGQPDTDPQDAPGVNQSQPDPQF